jgi:hypothetical protein
MSHEQCDERGCVDDGNDALRVTGCQSRRKKKNLRVPLAKK